MDQSGPFMSIQLWSVLPIDHVLQTYPSQLQTVLKRDLYLDSIKEENYKGRLMMLMTDRGVLVAILTEHDLYVSTECGVGLQTIVC